jgi:hypothetical protein
MGFRAFGSVRIYTYIPIKITKGEPLWLSGKVVKNDKINEIKRTRVRSPPRATSLKKLPNKN